MVAPPPIPPSGSPADALVLIIVPGNAAGESFGHRERFLHRLDDVLIIRIEQITENLRSIIRAG
jgi:hypothetical protein